MQHITLTVTVTDKAFCVFDFLLQIKKIILSNAGIQWSWVCTIAKDENPLVRKRYDDCANEIGLKIKWVELDKAEFHNGTLPSGDYLDYMPVIYNALMSAVPECDYVLNIGNLEEADEYHLAPTTSTTATLVLGDALAIVLSKSIEFKHQDFARFHPGGSLGKQLKKQ